MQQSGLGGPSSWMLGGLGELILSPCPSGAQLCHIMFWPGVFSSVCSISDLLQKQLGYAGANQWRG